MRLQSALPLVLLLGPSIAQDKDVFSFDPSDLTIEPEWLRSSQGHRTYYDASVWDDSGLGGVLTLIHDRDEGRDEDRLDPIYLSPGSMGYEGIRGIRMGRLARPTLTCDGAGQYWETCEYLDSEAGCWRVTGNDGLGSSHSLSESTSNAVGHRVCPLEEGVCAVWQQEVDGQYDVHLRTIRDSNDGEPGAPEVIASSSRSEWHPDVAATPDGDLCVVWDAHDGASFDVHARWRIDGAWGEPFVVADGPALQARAKVESDSRGRVWVLWEEDGANWGKPYRSLNRRWDNVSDVYGPLHRFRTLHVAQLAQDGRRLDVVPPFPMPSLEAAAKREGRREGVEKLGVYYERGELAVDRHDRLWVAWRHYADLQVGVEEPVIHHVEKGWRVYARCLTGEGWGPVYDFEGHQRDGMQRLSVAPSGDGIVLAWTTGRTDRRKDPQPRGVAWARVDPGPGPAAAPKLAEAAPRTPFRPAPRRPRPAPAEVGGETMQVYFGDLHRHTDLSLCFPFLDGSIDDAYRYAIEVAELDFLAITDHCRDIAKGDVLSQLWWRSTKEVTRHRLKGAFVPFFAFERSHRDTDHNVITLKEDVLENFPPPLPEYWARIEPDTTITIPHQPFIGKVWEVPDDPRRPLVEVYQGYRDLDALEDAERGLAAGKHLGFIASSDHLSTHGSYACVWAPELEDVAVFRSLRARRTYAATDRIRLVFSAGEHWMGERVSVAAAPTFRLEVDGTGPLERVAIVRGGKAVHTFELEHGTTTLRATWTAPAAPPARGETWYYALVQQIDGGRAWSSPIWVSRAQ